MLLLLLGLRCCADNRSGSYATNAVRSGASAAASPEQRLLALACDHAERLFGERVSSDWHNTWLRQSSTPAQAVQASAAMLGQSRSGMFGIYKRKARCVLR